MRAVRAISPQNLGRRNRSIDIFVSQVKQPGAAKKADIRSRLFDDLVSPGQQ
jgi:hypothetical protein